VVGGQGLVDRPPLQPGDRRPPLPVRRVGQVAARRLRPLEGLLAEELQLLLGMRGVERDQPGQVLRVVARAAGQVGVDVVLELVLQRRGLLRAGLVLERQVDLDDGAAEPGDRGPRSRSLAAAISSASGLTARTALTFLSSTRIRLRENRVSSTDESRPRSIAFCRSGIVADSRSMPCRTGRTAPGPLLPADGEAGVALGGLTGNRVAAAAAATRAGRQVRAAAAAGRRRTAGARRETDRTWTADHRAG